MVLREGCCPLLTTNDYDYDDYAKVLRLPADSGEQGGVASGERVPTESGEQGGVGVTGDTGAGDESTSTGL